MAKKEEENKATGEFLMANDTTYGRGRLEFAQKRFETKSCEREKNNIAALKNRLLVCITKREDSSLGLASCPLLNIRFSMFRIAS